MIHPSHVETPTNPQVVAFDFTNEWVASSFKYSLCMKQVNLVRSIVKTRTYKQKYKTMTQQLYQRGDKGQEILNL